MNRKLTITVDAAVYDALWRTVGKRRISQFIEELVRPHVLPPTLDAAYQAMAADSTREAEALAWCNALAKDMAHEAR